VGVKPKAQKEEDERDGTYEHVSGTARDLTYGKKEPETRKALDDLLNRMALEARGTFAGGGKITFDFKRRKAVLTIDYPITTLFEDYEGSDI
jgi:hypothetical protein